MKICPKCQKTYTDDNLNFCLEDGTVLQQAQSAPMPETVLINQPRPTSQPMQQGGQQPGWNTGAGGPNYSMQPPKKSSKAWIWVLLILGLVVIVCGGGLIGLVFYANSQAGSLANTTSPTPKVSTSPFSTKNNNTSTTTTSSSTRTSIDNLDLEEWVRPNSLYGNTQYKDGELIMSSKDAKYYYVLAGTADQKSVNADVDVTVRNLTNAQTNLGFGLVFHSNPTPLQQGYALLIDSAKKRYRVVHHTPGDEQNVISWTKSDLINDGTQPNKLEIRDQGTDIDIYINDTKVNTIKNIYGYPDGVLGLYTGSAIPIAFKNLEIKR